MLFLGFQPSSVDFSLDLNCVHVSHAIRVFFVFIRELDTLYPASAKPSTREGGGHSYSVPSVSARCVPDERGCVAGQFAAYEVRWVGATDSESATVDGTCDAGPPRKFDFKTLTLVTIVNGVELLAPEDITASSAPVLVEGVSAATEGSWTVNDLTPHVSQDLP